MMWAPDDPGAKGAFTSVQEPGSRVRGISGKGRVGVGWAGSSVGWRLLLIMCQFQSQILRETSLNTQLNYFSLPSQWLFSFIKFITYTMMCHYVCFFFHDWNVPPIIKKAPLWAGILSVFLLLWVNKWMHKWTLRAQALEGDRCRLKSGCRVPSRKFMHFS